ncbi:glycosyl hydrolase family 28-related protein [Ruegeria sp. 2205SS24-7]|uniref:glycosyl hydrolase family 28-related protein n=1 Tax=Ruegeria discodermiae TaxID=3064389 RepID=UPI002740BF2A|nr:glycosyl hydrolase family 28-related protein [Ruegeria sp. 2205SS24-7]MDP5217366.1 glycosyl hydrolase family 28-related protein [Ruegeria sp. 2205SS24-7]
MNKAITDGIVFMPPAFSAGLNVWSSGDGRPGSGTYANAPNAAFVPADADFGGCLEMQKTSATQKLRYMGQTPLLPGCYLRVRARVKAISGTLPTVRIAGWAGGAGEAQVTGVPTRGPAVALTSYGEVVEVSAIVGTGRRDGVDLPWGSAAIFGHFGINLEGPNGGIVRIDDIEIEDVTGFFLRDMINVVDIRDYGAVGDGVTSNNAAFVAADAAADGRRILVPEGVYHLADSLALSSEVEFAGTVTMPTAKTLVLTKNFDLPSYIAAFGNEELAFRKAFQALLNNSDHESLDMGGRKVSVTGPIDMQGAVPNRTSYATRRIIRNGQLDAAPSSAWDTETFASQCTYDPSSDNRKLRNVANIANIPVGALVTGNGVGREVYVRSKNVGAGEITLNTSLYDAAGTQNFTFTAFKYLLDFSGFSQLSKFGMQGIEFQCNSRCSAIRLAPNGIIFNVSDSFISRPKDRGITSIGGGCQGMLIDQCQFLSSEDALNVAGRKSIALNVNANDVKLRNNRATRFRHFAVLGGSNHIVLGNHFFQGDGVANGTRTAGLVLANTYVSTGLVGNYVDNCYIEWTNERDATPDYNSEFSFSALSITDNVFLSSDVAPWFSYIVVKPHGVGHFLNGVTVTGNKFRSTNGAIDRVERVDTSFAGFDYSRFKDVQFNSNSFHAIEHQVANPIRVRHTQSSDAKTWTVDPGEKLPFGARARAVDSVVPIGAVVNWTGVANHGMPYVLLERGSDRNKVDVVWQTAVRGTADVLVRIDKDK